jgi:hypothetical protein
MKERKSLNKNQLVMSQKGYLRKKLKLKETMRKALRERSRWLKWNQ